MVMIESWKALGSWLEEVGRASPVGEGLKKIEQDVIGA